MLNSRDLDDLVNIVNPQLATRRKSKEIRRPSIAISRELSNASSGTELLGSNWFNL